MGLFDRLRRLLGGDSRSSDPAAPEERSAAGGAADDAGAPVDDGVGATADDADADERTAGDATVATSGGAADRGETPARAPDSGSDAPPTVGREDAAATAAIDATLADAEDPRAVLQAEAEEFVAFWSDLELDYEPGSLRRLDRFVRETWGDDQFEGVAPDPDGDTAEERSLAEIVAGLGAYFGETLVRAFDAEWRQVPDVGWAVAVEDDGAVVAVSDPFGVAADAVRGEDAFAPTYDAVADAAGAPAIDGLAGQALLDLPPADADPETFAETAEAFVAAHSWYDLDYSPESLSAVDDIVDEKFAAAGGARATLGTAPAERAEGIGAYLGAVLIEYAGGEWVHDDASGWVVALGDGPDRPTVDVFGSTIAVLREGARFAEAFEAFGTGEGGAATVRGSGVHEDPETAAAARESAEELVAEYPEYDLDYSPASLARLDDLAAVAVVEDLREKLEGVDDEVAGMLVAGSTLRYGCYFCEVLRREHEGAVWIDEEGYTLALPDDKGAVAVSALRVAAAATVGDTTFEAAYERVSSDL